jgi:glutathione peroxidase
MTSEYTRGAGNRDRVTAFNISYQTLNNRTDPFANSRFVSYPPINRLSEMRKLYLTGMVMAASLFGASSVLDFTLNSIDGKPAPLAEYRGKVALIVNVASRCGYTPQYTGLEKIYEKYKDRGFVILGFPANNFGGQEPGTNEEIKTFCSSKYQVTFPMYAKVSVKGADTTPLYQFLTDKKSNPATGGDIQWNFTKFLVDRDGKVIARFEPDIEPESAGVTGAIEKALK